MASESPVSSGARTCHPGFSVGPAFPNSPHVVGLGRVTQPWLDSSFSHLVRELDPARRIKSLHATAKKAPRAATQTCSKQNLKKREQRTLKAVRGLPCGSAGKQLSCNAGDLGSIPGLGRSPGGGKDCPLQCSGLEIHGLCSPGGHKESARLSAFRFQGCERVDCRARGRSRETRSAWGSWCWERWRDVRWDLWRNDGICCTVGGRVRGWG